MRTKLAVLMIAVSSAVALFFFDHPLSADTSRPRSTPTYSGFREKDCGRQYDNWALTKSVEVCFDIELYDRRGTKSDCDVDFFCVDGDGEATDQNPLELKAKGDPGEETGTLCCSFSAEEIKADCKGREGKCRWRWRR